MRKLYVAATEACRSAFECEREVIGFDNANFTEVSIAVMTAEEAKAGKLERVESTAFGIPIVILNECGEVDPTLIGRADSIIDCKADDAKLYGRQIDTLALKYEKKVLPPSSCRPRICRVLWGKHFPLRLVQRRRFDGRSADS